MEITKEDVLALRLEIAELRREMAELRRENAVRILPMGSMQGGDATEDHGDTVTTEQIAVEWLEGEEAWKNMQK
jgi:hypothetical protein